MRAEEPSGEPSSGEPSSASALPDWATQALAAAGFAEVLTVRIVDAFGGVPNQCHANVQRAIDAHPALTGVFGWGVAAFGSSATLFAHSVLRTAAGELIDPTPSPNGARRPSHFVFDPRITFAMRNAVVADRNVAAGAYPHLPIYEAHEGGRLQFTEILPFGADPAARDPAAFARGIGAGMRCAGFFADHGLLRAVLSGDTIGISRDAAVVFHELVRLLPRTRPRGCVACGARLRDPHACGKCRAEAFCGKACAKAGWKRHKKDCATIANVQARAERLLRVPF